MAEPVQGRDAQHGGVIEAKYALVRIFGQQCVKHGARPVTVLVEHVALLEVVGPFTPGQRFGVEGDMADEVERIEILVQLGAHQFKRQTHLVELVENGLLAFGRVPALQEVVEAGRSASAAPAS